MVSADLESRAARIQDLIASNDLNEATRLLMDFVSDFAVNRARKREVIGIRQAFTALRSDLRTEGKTDANLRRVARLTQQVLELVDVIREEWGWKEPGWMAEVEHPVPAAAAPPATPTVPRDEFGGASLAQRLGDRVHLRAASPRAHGAAQPAGTPLVFEGTGMTRTHRARNASFTLHPLDLRLSLGEITAVVGANGNGKTTLLRLVAGTLRLDGGTVVYPALGGENATPYQIRTQIGIIPQDLVPWTGSLSSNLHFAAAVRGIRGERNQEEVDFVLYRLGLEGDRNARWRELSGGFRMRFELARILVSGARLLILDEPLAHLDVNTQLLFLDDLRHLVRSSAHPMAALVSSQHLHEVEAIADRIVFLDEGRAVYNGRVADFGEERAENCYEIACNAGRERLLEVLAPLGCAAVLEAGHVFHVHTPREVGGKELLHALLAYDVSIRYFRDISRSTRKLFKAAP